MKKMLWTCALLLFGVSFSQIVNVDFEENEIGPYTNNQARADFIPLKGASNWYAMEQNNGQNARIVLDDAGHQKVLELKYPAGCLGPNDNPLACAGQIKQPLPQSAEEMWIAYDVLFEEGFEFVKGGKLPGLCGGKCYTGGNRPSTGDGWSARVMWRPDGNVVQYLYFVDQATTYGDDAKWDLNGSIAQKKFIPGTWHRLVMKITLNTVKTEGAGEKNGKIRSWFDGELSLDLDTLRLRDFAAQKIDVFYLSTFHGGNDSSWSPTEDCYVKYDNFLISADSISVTDAPAKIFKHKQKTQKSSYRLMSGEKLFLNTQLEQSKTFLFYALDGKLLQKKSVGKGTASIDVPFKNKAILVTVK